MFGKMPSASNAQILDCFKTSATADGCCAGN